MHSDKTLQYFLNHISDVRPGIRRVILFGSRARGDSLPDSDYDLLLVVPKKTDNLLDALYEAVLDTLIETGRLVSLKIYTEAEFERLNNLSTPFMRRVRAEGVPVG